MFSKRTRGDAGDDAPPARRLRSNLRDLFLANEISGPRAQSLLQDASAAGSSGVGDLQGLGRDAHLHRNLLRRFNKGSRWPSLYEADIRMWDKRACEEKLMPVVFLLPHELLAAFRKNCMALPTLLAREGLDDISSRHLDRATRELGIPDGSEVVGMGLWMDGVTTKWDRSQSIDMVTMSLPGLPAEWRPLRVPLFVAPHDFVAKGTTFDDVLEVLTWSLRCATLGHHPVARHDGSAWRPSDTKRAKQAGRAVGCIGLLCQIVGDWKMLKDVFRFPQHNENAGCCFLCTVKPNGFRDTSLGAAWRRDRLDHWGFLARLRHQGRSVSPLFFAPGIRLECWKIDWLHVCDLGVAADFIGQMLTYLAAKMPGSTKERRMQALWQRVQALYREFPSDRNLDGLTENMLSPSARAPKLRGHGAEVRCLVPIAARLAQDLLADDLGYEAVVKGAMVELEACYNCLSSGTEGRRRGSRSTADASARFSCP